MSNSDARKRSTDREDQTMTEEIPRTVVELVDRVDGPVHITRDVYVNGEPVTVEQDGIDITYGPHEVTTVTLRILASEVLFTNEAGRRTVASSTGGRPADLSPEEAEPAPDSGGEAERPLVHNHGTEEGEGLACNERRTQDGRLVGACMDADPDEALAWVLEGVADGDGMLDYLTPGMALRLARVAREHIETDDAKELRQRELHHFEEEQKRIEVEAQRDELRERLDDFVRRAENIETECKRKVGNWQEGVAALVAERDDWKSRAEEAMAERDEWRTRAERAEILYTALRSDLEGESRGAQLRETRRTASRILHYDDERSAFYA